MSVNKNIFVPKNKLSVCFPLFRTENSFLCFAADKAHNMNRFFCPVFSYLADAIQALNSVIMWNEYYCNLECGCDISISSGATVMSIPSRLLKALTNRVSSVSPLLERCNAGAEKDRSEHSKMRKIGWSTGALILNCREC